MSIDVEDTAREIWRALEGISDGDGQAILREALAEAWDEGAKAADERSAAIVAEDNPYREDAPDVPTCDCGTCLAIEADRG